MLSKNLKQIRTNLGLSQQEIARQLGIHQVQYGTYERGTRKPSADIFEKLVQIYNVNINYLLTSQGEMFINNNKTEVNCTTIELEPGQILKVKYKEKL